MNKKRPIFLVGAQKSGTSTFFSLLTSHPEVQPLCTSSGRVLGEPHFFAQRESVVARNLDWYQNLIPDSRFFVDGSTSYLPSPYAAQLISRWYPEAIIFVIVRDPVERAYSGYWHMRAKHPPKEKRTFSRVVRDIRKRGEEISLEEAEQQSIQEAARKDLIDQEYFEERYAPGGNIQTTSKFQDSLWLYKYFRVSKYKMQVDKFERKFQNVNIIKTSDLSDQKILKRKLSYILNVKNNFEDTERKNTTMIKSRIFKIYKMLRDVKDLFLPSLSLEDVVGENARYLREKMLYKKKKSIKEKGNLYNECREMLSDEFRWFHSQ